MQSGKTATKPPILALLATLFVAAYFLLFAGDGLRAYFTFDDGMNLVHLHRVFQVSFWTNILDAVRVFTPAYRPLGALFYRPLYALFGFNPLPFRMAAYGLMIFNIVLTYRFSRVFDAAPEAAVLSVLLFSYNGSMVDLYYNTGTIYDLMCFPLYIGAVIVYVRAQSRGQLSVPVMLLIGAMFLAALDAKEIAVTLPAVLVLYEAFYRFREYRSLATSWRTGAFLAAMFAASAWFTKVKVTEMGANGLYRPHRSPEFILNGIGHYFEQLFYLRPGSFGSTQMLVAVALLLVASAVLKSRAAAYGAFFFLVTLLPLSVIEPRTGYAAYIAYPGLTLAIGLLLNATRSALLRISGKANLQTSSAVVLFLAVATFSITSFAHTRKVLMSNALWDQGRLVEFIRCLRSEIPEFPPDARVLILDDPWRPDWGLMFLADLLYHNPIWVDRVRNGFGVEDRASYDLLLSFEQPLQTTRTTRILAVRRTWDTRWIPYRPGRITLSAPDPQRAFRSVSYSASAHSLTVPGLSNVKIDALFRTPSGPHLTEGWCTLDSSGTCSVASPAPGPLSVDWVRPSQERWIFTAAGTSR
jgi:hypothetical protein